MNHDSQPQGDNKKYDFDKLFVTASVIRECFHNVWNMLSEGVDIDIGAQEAYKALEGLTIYDILDGTRSTLTSKPGIDERVDGILYAIELIHTLRALGAKACLCMLHTSYNRERVKKSLTVSWTL